MNLNLSGPIVTPKSGTAESILVLLHGYGSDGHDLIGLAPYFADLLPAPVIFSPNAPARCDMNPSGYQWFPLGGSGNFTNLTGIEDIVGAIHTMLEGLWSETGLGAGDTILAGFSQGGMLSLYSGLSLATPLRGIVSFSGGLPFDTAFWPEIASQPPVLLVHGDSDQVVPPMMSVATRDNLLPFGITAEHYVAPNCPHAIAPDGLDRARRFVARLFPDFDPEA